MKTALSALLALTTAAGLASAQSPARFKAHDMSRPRPPVVRPAAQALPVPPPADAIVLFDGGGLSEWRSADGGPAKWVIKDGAIESVAGAGYLFSARGFGDVQLHVEWAAPVPARGKSQGRGNSGVFLMGLYEVQVLDSYENDTYPDGQAAAVYGQYPPLVNACRPPGEWQSYDIVFRRPRFRPDGGLVSPARITVVHNGILVQDAVEPWGPTSWLQALPYTSHADKLPLAFQDHGNPVRYRNIWLRELPEGPTELPTPDARPVVTLPSTQLDRYVGRYQVAGGARITVTRRGGQLLCDFMFNGQPLELVPHSDRAFSLRFTAGDVDFDVKPDGAVAGLTFRLGGDTQTAAKVE
ncbi:MAG: family 16 glycoside hydrolase [Vicinamibacteria bacterium]